MVEINGAKRLLTNLVVVSAFPVIVVVITPMTVDRVIDVAADNPLITAGIVAFAVFFVLFGKSSSGTHHIGHAP